MTVDCCIRVWTGPDPFGAAEASEASRGGANAGSVRNGALREAMHCVRAGVVLGYRSERMGVHEPAERIAAVVHSDPDRLVGFAGIDPMAPSATDDLARAVDLGLRGVAISPADQGCRPTHERCMDVLEWCAERGLPVSVSNPGLGRSESVLEFARPALLDEALREVPGLTVVLGDIGRGFLDEALLLCAKHESCFAEISTLVARPGMLYFALLAAHERGVIHKLVFGSGYPDESPEGAIERVYSVNGVAGGPVGGGGWPLIPRESLRGIVERDALGLVPPVARPFRSAGERRGAAAIAAFGAR